MPATDAQRRASKKWNDKNKDKIIKIVCEWKVIPENKQKQALYMKKYLKRRNMFLQEFRRLSNILLEN
tara:strand:- start:53 stop:256 length:204 start_codon:yes stop_codon:yes gene_type:complete